MATPTYPKTVNKLAKEYFLGKGTIELIPFKPMEVPPPWHLHKTGTTIFHVECKERMEYTEIKCPICEMLKPKTKWQRIKSWKLWNRFWLKMGILIASMGLCLQIWNFVTMLVQF